MSASSSSTIHTAAVAQPAAASHIGVKRRHGHLDTKQDSPEEESTSEVNRMEIDQQEERKNDQAESDTQRQSKRTRPTPVDEEVDVCVICHEDFSDLSASQTDGNQKIARVLPSCTDKLCHSCIVKLIDRKGLKRSVMEKPEEEPRRIVRSSDAENTIECPHCHRDQPLFQHPGGRTDSESLASLYPTRAQFTAELKRSESAVLVLPEKVQKVNVCSENGCEQLATHLCIGCGVLCREHESLIHQRYVSGHECYTFAQLEQKKQREREALKKKRTHDFDAAISELGRIQKSWDENNESRQLKEIDAQFDLQAGRLTQLKQQIVEWQQELQLQRHQFNASSNQFNQQVAAFRNSTTTKEEEMTRAQQLSFTESEVEFQRLINLTQIRQSAAGLELRAKQIRILPNEYPSLESIQQLVRPSILPSVSNKIRETLDKKFLNKSDQSLARATLIYKANLHGWTKKDFMRRCQGKSHTLIVVKVADNGYVFGAYIAPALDQADNDDDDDGGAIFDPTGKSFVFSLVNWYRQPLRLPLIDPVHMSVIDLSFEGIALGHQEKDANNKVVKWVNFELFTLNRPANKPDGNYSNYQDDCAAFQLDQASRNLLPKGTVLDCTALGGAENFMASEIEVYQL